MAETPIETALPKLTDEGHELAGEFPLNHRLRAEALARAGIASDPDELIPDTLIADAKERVARDDEAAAAAAAEAQRETSELRRMKTADLEALAAEEGVDLSAAATNADRVAAIETAREMRGETISADTGASA